MLKNYFDPNKIPQPNWDYIAKYQKLSEEFIKEYENKWNWNYIAINQKLSEEFIKEYADKLNENNIQNQLKSHYDKKLIMKKD